MFRIFLGMPKINREIIKITPNKIRMQYYENKHEQIKSKKNK